MCKRYQPQPSFDDAIQFLYEQHGNLICDDLVQAYCKGGLLKEVDGVLTVTDKGRAELRKSRRTVAH